ncbi:hydroxyacylglutathione hydrolase [gamma proteobacterium HTCC5015]|nr:hydroxyacylglutathione hydrolase [gamma proteobacterium HTCC5015]
MIFRQLFESVSSTYTYILADSDSREAVIIDPVKEQVPQYLRLVEELNIKLIKGIDTHTHADHITGLGELRDETGLISIIGEKTGAECISQRVADGEMVDFGQHQLKALYTPGHTDDSFSFYINDPELQAVFTGDTLLIRGTGRTDFQQGDAYAQYDSLFNKLLKLPDETRVYPGHDYKGWMMSCIAEERDHNPRLQVDGPEAYADIMHNLNLPNPKMMDVAIPANLACGQA